MSINALGQIAGLFQDTAENVKGFLLNRANGTFRTVRFPFADAFRFVDQIDDNGVMAVELADLR